MQRIIRHVVLGIGLLVGLPTVGIAQTDSLAILAARAGRLAASEVPVGGRFVLGLLGAIPVGLFGLPIVMQGDRGPAVASSAGLVIIVGAAFKGDTEPHSAQLGSVATREPAYQEAFVVGYSDALKGRRRRAAFGGAGIGAVLAVGTVLLALSP